MLTVKSIGRVFALLTIALLATGAYSEKIFASEKAISVGILDFESSIAGNTSLGGKISETLSVLLSMEDGFEVVDRQKLEKSLQEHELSLTGMVAADKAVKIGQITGANILVTGKAFTMGEKVFITAKVIGTETTRFTGALVSGKTSDDTSELVMQLSAKVVEQIQKNGKKLFAQERSPDTKLAEIKKILEGKHMPVIAVFVSEEHMGTRQQIANQNPDPAVETEIKKILLENGFVIQDIPANKFSRWAQFAANIKGKSGPWPQGLDKADYILTGEAFSEFGVKIGNLNSCIARVEYNLISRDKGRVVVADRQLSRDVDLSENIAGKKALQKAGQKLAERLLGFFSKNLPDKIKE